MANTHEWKRTIYIQSKIKEVKGQCKGLARIIQKYFLSKACVIQGTECPQSDNTVAEILDII